MPDPSEDGRDERAATQSDRPVLVVGLDGTLVRSDMRHEKFWASFSKLAAGGRTATALPTSARESAVSPGADSVVDVATLPYEPSVIEYVRSWRKDGGSVALVTSVDEAIARRVADHLDLFDAVHGSTQERPLTGKAKAAFLVETYGREGFSFLGRKARDLPIWAEAASAIVLGDARGTQSVTDARGRSAERVSAQGASPAALLKALRPHQWLKNLLVFVPIMSDPSRSDWDYAAAFAVFVALSLAASAGYIINDLLDLADDRSHPRKSRRPFASGALSAATGTLLVPSLLAASVVIAALSSLATVLIVAVYFCISLAYSLRIKEYAVVDICTLAALYTIRIVAGAIAVGVTMSVWLLAFSLFLFFSLAATKRLGELSDADAAGRAVSRRGYTSEDRRVLSQMAIAAGYIGVLVLALYMDEPSVQELYGEHRMFWGVCALMIFWVSHIVLTADRGDMDDDPIVWSVRDPVSLATISAMGILMAMAVML